eukprot:3895296-Pyramimonas_sp.AAC.1
MDVRMESFPHDVLFDNHVGRCGYGCSYSIFLMRDILKTGRECKPALQFKGDELILCSGGDDGRICGWLWRRVEKVRTFEWMSVSSKMLLQPATCKMELRLSLSLLRPDVTILGRVLFVSPFSACMRVMGSFARVRVMWQEVEAAKYYSPASDGKSDLPPDFEVDTTLGISGDLRAPPQLMNKS